MIDDVPVLKVREIAEQLKVSTMLVYREINSGKLRALRVGESIRVREDDFESYLHRNTSGGECPLCDAYHEQVKRLSEDNARLKNRVAELEAGFDDE